MKKISATKSELMSAEDKRTEVEILLKFCEEDWEQRRQSENQRSTVTNFILTIASAITILIVNDGLSLSSLPLAFMLIVIGIFGAIAVAKLYERGDYHMAKIHEWRERISELYPTAELQLRHKRATAFHATKFGKTIRERIRLHKLWINFNIGIAILGAIVSAITLFINFR